MKSLLPTLLLIGLTSNAAAATTTLLECHRLVDVESGKVVDIVAVKGDPLDDVSILSGVSCLMKDGVVYRDD